MLPGTANESLNALLCTSDDLFRDEDELPSAFCNILFFSCSNLNLTKSLSVWAAEPLPSLFFPENFDVDFEVDDFSATLRSCCTFRSLGFGLLDCDRIESSVSFWLTGKDWILIFTETILVWSGASSRAALDSLDLSNATFVSFAIFKSIRCLLRCNHVPFAVFSIKWPNCRLTWLTSIARWKSNRKAVAWLIFPSAVSIASADQIVVSFNSFVLVSQLTVGIAWAMPPKWNLSFGKRCSSNWTWWLENLLNSFGVATNGKP